jgi:hypothetical protein
MSGERVPIEPQVNARGTPNILVLGFLEQAFRE